MSRRKLLLLMFGLALVALLGTGCGSPAATSTSVPPAATRTPVPPATIRTPVPPAATPTPILPRFEVVDEVILNCGTENAPALWGIWKVKNNDSENWIKRGEAEVVAEGSGGTVLYRAPFSFSYGAGALGWMSSGNLFYGKGSKIKTIRLQILKTEWEPLDATANQYDFAIKFVSHSTDEGNKHQVKVEFHNKSDLVMTRMRLSAVVFDPSGEIVDVLNSWYSAPVGDRRIPFGAKQFIVAKSVLPEQCARTLDLNDFSVDYWIQFDTINGQSVTQFSHVESVREAEPIVVKAIGSGVTRDGIKVKFTVHNRDDASHIVKVKTFALADWVCPPPDQGDKLRKTYKDARHYGLGFVEVQGGETVEASIIADDRDLGVYGTPSYQNKRFYERCDIVDLGMPEMRWDLLSEEAEALVKSVRLVDFFTGQFEVDTLSSFHFSFTVENRDTSAHRVGVECRYIDNRYPFFPLHTSTDIYSVEVPAGDTATSSLKLVNADWYKKWTGQIEHCEIIQVDSLKYREARP